MGLLAVAGLVTAGLAGCAERNDLEEDEVRVELDGQTHRLTLAGCGLADELFLLEAGSGSTRLALRLILVDDRVDREESTVTFDVPDLALTAGLGAVAGLDEDRSGTIESARVRGDRVDLVAEALSTSGDPTPHTIEIAARCSAADEAAASPTRPRGSGWSDSSAHPPAR